MKQLTSNEIKKSGGMCFCYIVENYSTDDIKYYTKNNIPYIGLKGDPNLTTCKERCCSNYENKAWKYSSAFTYEGAKEEDASRLCNSNEIKKEKASMFSFRWNV